uniref:Secreted protein n=1 Tax=Thraustotheca clavata TaxID=74557 RepID=A0A0A7CMD1_9STRA|nr:secreted protein [Thraustotheca clavata]
MFWLSLFFSWTMALSLVELDIGVGCNTSNAYPNSKSIMSFTINEPTANLLLVHFAFVRLAPRDYILLRPMVNSSKPAETSERITSSSNSLGAFFSMPLYTIKATVELHTFGSNAEECYGFQIDGVRTNIRDNAKFANELESICGTDDSMNAECYVNSPSYTKAKAVVRMLTNRESGSDFCTGWLLGCEGHLLTNQHCIQSPDDAINTQYEFMAEGMSCTDNCEAQGACSSRQFVRGGILIATSKPLDYSLVLLDNIPLGLGFLQFRASGPVLNEKIYIPQYPMGWGKRIAVVKGNQPGTITSVTLSGCAPNQAGYMLDTQPGSSGSPVLAAKDNKVVALHHCGGCPNAGIQSQFIIEDLRKKRALPACAVA